MFLINQQSMIFMNGFEETDGGAKFVPHPAVSHAWYFLWYNKCSHEFDSRSQCYMQTCSTYMFKNVNSNGAHWCNKVLISKDIGTYCYDSLDYRMTMGYWILSTSKKI